MPIRPLRFLVSCGQLFPELADTDTAGWKHTVLQAVKVPPVDRRDELA